MTTGELTVFTTKQVVSDQQAQAVLCSFCAAPGGGTCVDTDGAPTTQIHRARRKAARLAIYGDAQAKRPCTCLNRDKLPKSLYDSQDAAARWIRTFPFAETPGKEFSVYRCPTDRAGWHITTKKGAGLRNLRGTATLPPILRGDLL